MKTRLQRRILTGIYLLIGAGFPLWYSWPKTPPPVPAIIVGERVLLDPVDPAIHCDDGQMAFSPTGRYILFGKSETNVPILIGYLIHTISDDVGWDDNTVIQPFLLDASTGKQERLPVPSYDEMEQFVSQLDYPFATDESCIYLCATGKRPWKGTLYPHFLVYDIRSHGLSEPMHKDSTWYEYDEIGRGFLITIEKEYLTKLFQFWITDFHIERVSLSGQTLEAFPFNGIVCGPSSVDRAVALTWPRKPGRAAPIAPSPDLDLVNLRTGRILKHFRLGQDWPKVGDPEPFYTPDKRFLCFGDGEVRGNLPAICRNWLSARLPFVSSSNAPEEEYIRLSRFWDTVTDETFTLRNVRAFAQGPSASSVMITLIDEHELTVILDLATGREFLLPSTEDRLICARGRFLVYLRTDSKGGKKLVLIEVALPSDKR